MILSIKKEKKKTAAGYTLLEILIALAIFSIGILAVGQMHIRSMTGNTRAKMNTQAFTWAQDRIEALMAMDYNNTLLDDTGYDAKNDSISASTPKAEAQNQFTIRWHVDEDPTDGVPRTKTIRVDVIRTDNLSSQATIYFVRGQDVGNV